MFSHAYLILLITYFWRGIRVLQGKPCINNKLIFASCMLLSVNAGSNVLAYTLSNAHAAEFWRFVGYIALYFFPAVAFHFTILFTGKRFKFIPIIYIPAVLRIVSLAAFLDKDSPGLQFLYYLSAIAYYILYLAVTLLLFVRWGFRSKYKREKKQAIIIVSASGAVASLAVIYQLLAMQNLLKDNNPIPEAIIIAGLLIASFAVEKFRSLEIKSFIESEHILNRIYDMIVYSDIEGKILQVNQKLLDTLSYKEGEILSLNIARIIPEELYIEMNSYSSSESLVRETVFLCKNNDAVPVHLTAEKINDQFGDQVGWLMIAQDLRERKRLQQEISEREKAQKELTFLSMHDALTGVYNRMYFERKLKEISGSAMYPVSIILCDLDGLKFVNDTLGHDSGDRLLKIAADILALSCKHKADQIIARIGGDEFAVILLKADKPEVSRIIENIRINIDEYNEKNADLPMYVSIGHATAEDGTHEMQEIIKEADNNMYRQKMNHRQSIQSTIVDILMKTLEARDFNTEGHAERMQDLAVELAERLGFSDSDLSDIKLFAMFHDIGKVGVPDHILFKEGPLTEAERSEMRKHSEIGYRIAQSSHHLVHIADWILMHHEWWNGKGYPLGLKGEEIPIQSRILAIVDAYDAMTNDRPYRKAMSGEDAIKELVKNAGIQFDPRLTECFIELLREKASEKAS